MKFNDFQTLDLQLKVRHGRELSKDKCVKASVIESEQDMKAEEIIDNYD